MTEDANAISAFGGGSVSSERPTKTKRPRKPISEQNKPGRYDPRNQLNDLTGKEWLRLTASFWVTEPSSEDKAAYAHPAPFLVRDVQKLISMFTKSGMTVLDPFVGSGTTLIAAAKIGRQSIGIDINKEFKPIAESRLIGYEGEYRYLVGDALNIIDDVGPVDYVVTSPPYHNILRNTSKGVRHNNGKQYRMGPRDGIEYYTDHPNDLGNFDTYDSFCVALSEITRKIFSCLREGKYCTLILSDFTVNKIEVCVQADIVRLMLDAGFEFCGTTVLLQPVKPLYPFGYPYSYKINHHHQNMMTFRKPRT